MMFVQMFTAALLAGVVTIVGHFVLTWLQGRNDEKRHRRERLTDRYSELVAIVTAEIHRAKAAREFFDDNTYDLQDGWELEADFLAKRTAIQLDLTRIAFQIRLLEDDWALAQEVRELANTVPKLTPGTHIKPLEFLCLFDPQIDKFEAIFKRIVDGVIAKHSVILNVIEPRK